MKNLLFVSLFAITGCSTFLRYEYDVALRNLPHNTRVLKHNMGRVDEL